MNQTHPERQKKVLYALQKLGINYQRCTHCNTSEGTPGDLHIVRQLSGYFYIMPDRETKEEEANKGIRTMGSRNHEYKIAIITCKHCGYSAMFDLHVLEEYI